jgi:PAS domain S-box-containing protein
MPRESSGQETALKPGEKRTREPDEVHGEYASAAEARLQAEQRLARLTPGRQQAPAEAPEMQRLLHELGVHQIELEIQNEQLRHAQAALERSRDRYLDLFEGAPVGYVTLDMDGVILDSNRMAGSLLGIARHDGIRRTLVDQLAAHDRRAYLRHQGALFRGDGPQYCELRLDDGVDAPRWVGIQIALTRDDESGAPRCRAALLDIDARVRMQAGVSRLAAIVASSEDAIISRGADGCVTSWNDAARRLFGYEADQMVGRDLDILVPADRRAEERDLVQKLARGESVAHLETERLARGGVRVPVSISLSPVRAEDGRVTGSALIGRDISERLRADRTKDAFIATLAHELRNPLAPIRNALEVMRREGTGSSRLDWCRTILERQVAQMARLLEDLLDISRMTSNKIELRCDRMLLVTAIEQALESTRPLLDTRDHVLTLDLAAEPIEVHGDLTRLTQVFTNLLNNAAKYTDAGGRIDVSLYRDHDCAVVRVRDSGIGIDSANLPRVFDMFSQLRPALQRAGGGLGIGLALARALVEMHGGRIEATSAGAGAGTEFVVRLPVLATAGPQSPDEAGGRRDLADEVSSMRVLVVDDNVDAAQTLAAMLELYGEDVRTAFGGLQALEVVERWQPDAMILDIGMADLDGYELCRRVRALGQRPPPLIIACTGWGQNEDRDRTRRAGFDAHVVKPVEPEAILTLLTGHPASRHGDD